jgi:hypothetical protein
MQINAPQYNEPIQLVGLAKEAEIDVEDPVFGNGTLLGNVIWQIGQFRCRQDGTRH